MVLAVIAGLMALAAPFVFSMLLQGRNARSEVHAVQARAGAEGAAAMALAHLHKGLRYDPQDPRTEIFTLADLKVSLDLPGERLGRLEADNQSTAGLLWSARIEDEQGKINLLTAPPALIGNLLGSALLTEKVEKGGSELVVDNASVFPPNGGTVSLIGERTPLRYSRVSGNVISLQDPVEIAHIESALVFDGRARMIADYKFKQGGGGASFLPFRSLYEIKAALGTNPRDALGPDEFARIERHLTLNSGVGGPWWGQQERPSEQTFISSLRGFNVEKGDGFAPGTLVRVVQNGVPQAYARVRSANIKLRTGGAFIALDDEIGVDFSSTGGNSAYIQPELKHPINLNTASREVLEAVVTGVCLYGGKEAVTRYQAGKLVDFLLDGKMTYADAPSFRKALDAAHTKGILTATQRDAVWINASEPNSGKLRTSTVPFCFYSCGSFTIEGTGLVNAENGVQLSRHVLRQLVTLPSPWPGRFKIEHQAGFQYLLDQGLGSRVTTFPIWMGQSRYRRANPSVREPSPTSGGVRLDVGQCGPHGLAGEFIDHCEDEKDKAYRQDGYEMPKHGPFTIPNGGGGGGAGGGNSSGNPRRGGGITGMGARLANLMGPQTGGGPPNPNAPSQPTAVELWYKPLGGGQGTFYDAGTQEEERNHVSFSYDPGSGLVVRIYDAGLECLDGPTNGWQHLRRPPVEYIYPADLASGEWWHVAASWKSSWHNGQEIRVDANPNPRKGEEAKFKPGAKLAADIDIEEINSLELEEAENAHFPKSGAVQVGEEIIEYAQRSGNTLQMLSRGARLSAAAKHSSGEWVMPYGFSVSLSQDLPVGGATLVEYVEVPARTRTQVNSPSPPAPLPFVLDTESAKLPVDDATSFPPTGFILVRGELIYYGKKTATTFEKLQRAQSGNVGSPARNLQHQAPVSLASIEITDSSQYDNSGIVQIDDEQNDKLVEWIEYGAKNVVNGKHYLIARLAHTGSPTIPVGNPQRQVNGSSLRFDGFRNKFGIGSGTIGRESSHMKKAKVIPVVRMSGPHCGNQRSPYGEQGVSEVSVVERGARDGDLRYVKQAYINQYPNFSGPDDPCRKNFVGWGFDYFVGLNDFVSRRFPGGQTRFLKWPSGELPDIPGAKRTVAADRNGDGLLRGYVDEIKVNTLQTGNGRIAMTSAGTGVQSGDEEILVEEYNFWPRNYNGNIAGGRRVAPLQMRWPRSGLIRVGDELMFFTQNSDAEIDYFADVFPNLKDKPPRQNKADRWVRVPCPTRDELWPNLQSKRVLRLSVQRGVLETKAEEHPPGAQVMLFDGMAVSYLKSGLGDFSDSFSVDNGAGFPLEGYAWIGREVLSWQQAQNTSFTGIRNFRGRFGTSPQNHDAGEIVRCLPFRYWDRAPKFYDGEGIAYIQAGYAANDAIWDSIELTVTGTEERPRPNLVQPRVLARFDNRPNWDTEPNNAEGGLYEFRGKAVQSAAQEGKASILPLKGTQRGGARGDQIEIRVYWEFLPRAFYPNNEWKRTFTIEKLRATYHSPLIMRRLDEIERR